jgi:signal peptidase I
VRAETGSNLRMSSFHHKPRFLLSAAIVAVVGVVAFVGLGPKAFVNPSTSMMPTIEKDDHLLAVPPRRIERGDVVIFKHPTMPNIVHVKRVIGLPGERIEWAGGRLIVNGNQVDRKRIDDERPTLPDSTEDLGDPYFFREKFANLDLLIMDDDSYQRDANAIYVPEEAYYLLGDFRSNSADSRMFGPVPKSNITGKIFRMPWARHKN